MERKIIKYDAFVKKFQPKKTTDDCYTPEAVYGAVLDWVERNAVVEFGDVVRPFYPGGDYEHAYYPDGCAVIDNPPFSVLEKILAFYVTKGVRFFLFAPALTLFSGKTRRRLTLVSAFASVVYENGAVVRTSFVTNMLDPDIAFMTAPDLKKGVEAACKKETKKIPKMAWPYNVLGVQKVQKIASVPFVIRRNECEIVSSLKDSKIFGGGLLVSDSAAAELRAAELRAAELRAAELRAAELRQKEEIIKVELSPENRRIINRLNGEGTDGEQLKLFKE